MPGLVDIKEDLLVEAFNHFTDILDRCNCPFVLFGETARSVIDSNGDHLKGDGIYAGVRKSDVTESVASMLRTLASNVDIRLGMEDYVKTENDFSWKYKTVPIKVKIIHNKYEFMNNPTTAWLYADNYSIPNPFTDYWKVRNVIK